MGKDLSCVDEGHLQVIGEVSTGGRVSKNLGGCGVTYLGFLLGQEGGSEVFGANGEQGEGVKRDNSCKIQS